ncbi:MAG: phosphoglucomutase [Acidilobus sp.]
MTWPPQQIWGRALPLFGTAGARGPYPSRINPRLVYDISLTAANVIAKNVGSAVVGYDPRLTSPLLAFASAAGFMAGGLDVILIGEAPLPVIAYEVKRSRSVLGASISASHNPPADNGIKLFKANGMELFRAEEEVIERSLGSYSEVEWSKTGSYLLEPSAIESYINDAVQSIDRSKWKRAERPRLIVDCANGAASIVTPKLLRKAGIGKVVTVNCNLDGTFPGRLPEPRPDVLQNLMPVLDATSAEAMLAHDGDADRLAIVLRGYGFVKQDLVIALLAERALRDHKGSIIVSVDVGYEVEEVVEESNGKLLRAPLGRLHEYLASTPDALMAAEPWKYIEPAWGPWPDGIYQALVVVDEIMSRGTTFHEAFSKMPSYPSARLSFVVAGPRERELLYREAVAQLEKALSPAKVVDRLEIDGVRLQADDRSWILMRPSGTEFKVRAYAQALTPARLLEVIKSVKDLMSNVASAVGVKILDVEEAIDLASH